MRLTVERMAKRWSKNHLAQEARITPSDMSKIENRRMVPYEAQLRKLAVALEFPEERCHELMEEVQLDGPAEA